MKIYTVWNNSIRVGGIGEKCVRNEAGDYVGVSTGNLYSQEEHYHSEQHAAQIVAADETNQTGMYHLSAGYKPETEENNRTFKQKLIGCFVTVEQAHKWGDVKVYRCLEFAEYFSANELKLLTEV